MTRRICPQCKRVDECHLAGCSHCHVHASVRSYSAAEIRAKLKAVIGIGTERKWKVLLKLLEALK